MMIFKKDFETNVPIPLTSRRVSEPRSATDMEPKAVVMPAIDGDLYRLALAKEGDLYKDMLPCGGFGCGAARSLHRKPLERRSSLQRKR